MVQANPFMAFQSDPFFNFGGGSPLQPMSAAPVSSIQSPFADILETEPDIPFQGALQRGNLTPNQMRQFQNQRGEVFRQFQGLLDQQIRAGLTPDLRFADFMGNFNFGREAFRTPPGQRVGGGTSQFAPKTTFIR
jgi:hypothetical protein